MSVRVRGSYVAAWLACAACAPPAPPLPTVTTGQTTSNGTDGDTGAPIDSGSPTGTPGCPAERLQYVACVETTAVLDPSGDPYTAPIVYQGTGTVVDVGGVLPTLGGSAPIHGFQACDTSHTHQIRLLDGDGETWTFGWDVDGAIDDDSAATISDGATIDFYAAWVFLSYSAAAAVLLSDATGPLFLLELNEPLDDPKRGGVSVRPTGQTCTGAIGGTSFEFYQHAFGWEDGSADLWGGQSASIPLPKRSMTWVLGDSSYMKGCLDGCSQTWWAGWAEE